MRLLQDRQREHRWAPWRRAAEDLRRGMACRFPGGPQNSVPKSFLRRSVGSSRACGFRAWKGMIVGALLQRAHILFVPRQCCDSGPGFSQSAASQELAWVGWLSPLWRRSSQRSSLPLSAAGPRPPSPSNPEPSQAHVPSWAPHATAGAHSLAETSRLTGKSPYDGRGTRANADLPGGAPEAQP